MVYKDTRIGTLIEDVDIFPSSTLVPLREGIVISYEGDGFADEYFSGTVVKATANSVSVGYNSSSWGRNGCCIRKPRGDEHVILKSHPPCLAGEVSNHKGILAWNNYMERLVGTVATVKHVYVPQLWSRGLLIFKCKENSWIWMIDSYTLPELIAVPKVADSRFPHLCPACGSAAYIGLHLIDCSNSRCEHKRG